MQPIKKNRTEIQCLRCLAICAVVAYHVYPTVIPGGYLGLDVFFVLSGYLMTMILNFSSTKKLSIVVIFDFYRRRLKRLLPAYLVVILSTMILGAFILTQIDYKFLQFDGFIAVLFGTNIEGLLLPKNYLLLNSVKPFLLHTWSLSAEMQYYFVAPFLLAWIASVKHPIYTIVVLSLISWGFQVLTLSDIWWYFCSVPARLWQFLLGTLAFYIEQKDHSQDIPGETPVHNTRRQIVISLLLCILIILPIKTENTKYGILIVAFRTTATVLAAYIVYLGPPKLSDGIVTRGILYFGDISYSIYLVHMPLTIFMLYRYEKEGNNFILILVFLALSVVQYELFEKTLLQATNFTVFFVCVLLFAIVVPLCTVSGGLQLVLPRNSIDLVTLNEDAATCFTPSECPYDAEVAKYYPESIKDDANACTYEGTGKLTVLVTGNTFAKRQVHTVLAAFRERYKKLYFISHPKCFIFENVIRDDKFECEEMRSSAEAFMRGVRPDITFVIQGGSMGLISYYALSIDEVKKEPLVKEMKRVIEIYSNFTRKLIIVEPHAILLQNPAQMVARKLKTGQSLDNYNLPEEQYKISQMYAWWRHLAAMEGCQNCMTINQTNVFCHEDTQKCDLYEKDTGMSLFCDYDHLSDAGLDRIQPLYKNAINKVLYELDA